MEDLATDEGGWPGRAAEGRALLGREELEAVLGRLAAGGDGEEGRRRAVRLRSERAMLELAGERGRDAVTVEELISRAETNRAEFYEAFAGKDECLARACAAAGEALCERLLAPCGEAGDWAAGLGAALGELAGLVDSEPAVMRALVVEAWSAGTAVAAGREQVLGRLSDAIDRARREPTGTRHAPPPITPRFILAGIESAVVGFLGAPEEGGFAARTPGLLWLAVDFYRGPAAARAAVAAAAREAEPGQGRGA